jgi:catechol 2,3-dioxygenase-like lactoylglutathione lyase family enzyme
MYPINHVGIIVEDADKAAEFYISQFGAAITRRHKTERVNIIFVSSGATILEFIQYLQGAEGKKIGSIDHVAYTVPNMEEAVQKLKDTGVKLISEVPGDFGKDKIFFFQGLNGEKLEFVEIG